ncbi:MAG: hypothetical protein ABR898_12145 [Terracidiphilus sp.]
MAAKRTMTFGIVVGNRGFFPGHLAKTGREEIISLLEAAGAKAVVLSPESRIASTMPRSSPKFGRVTMMPSISTAC